MVASPDYCFRPALPYRWIQRGKEQKSTSVQETLQTPSLPLASLLALLWQSPGNPLAILWQSYSPSSADLVRKRNQKEGTLFAAVSKTDPSHCHHGVAHRMSASTKGSIERTAGGNCPFMCASRRKVECWLWECPNSVRPGSS